MKLDFYRYRLIFMGLDGFDCLLTLTVVDSRYTTIRNYREKVFRNNEQTGFKIGNEKTEILIPSEKPLEKSHY